MKDVVIAGYLRTAQSRSRPGEPGRDWLHQIRADDLLAKILPESEMFLVTTLMSADLVKAFTIGKKE